ncbi:MAG: cyclase family protein, partial [Gammaproteobacteria bacterium]|nr:cyclase family protein [Gammaproteobacteria bacterium]
YPPRHYAITVIQPGQDLGPTMGANRATGNDDLLYTWMGIGSQLDGLGHMGIDHVYYNGLHAKDFVTTKGLTALSIEKIPPMVGRGVLLDMTRHFGENPLPAGTVFNEAEIKAQATAQGVEIGKGDVVLFHTGWLNLAGVDNETFMGGEPGLGMGGAKYLASLDVVAVGADTWGLEAVPHENPELMFPVHPELLAKNGIYILENMDVRALAADEGWEFLFVLGQPRFEGAVQAVINPVAIR